MAASTSGVISLNLQDDLTPFSSLINQQNVAIFETLVLDSGRVLKRVPLAYKTWGQLSPGRDNVMVVCHALSGTCDVEDWWGPLMGRGKVFDPTVFFIVCCNVLGSPYGTASPLTRNPDTGEPYGADFPYVTIRDTVRLQRMLLDALGVNRVQVVIGGSLGGMQVLEWAFYGPDFVRSIVPIATSGKHSAWCISWSEAQRQAIYGDPAWADGRYKLDHPPNTGLSAARMTAMLTYRSRNSFEARFGRKLQSNAGKEEASGASGRYHPEKDVFSAQSYLHYQGEKFVKRFDANCYIRITQMLDSHDISLERGDYFDVLRSIKQPSFVIGIESDGLFLPAEQSELAEHLSNAELAIIESPDGHDGFLLEFHRMNELITTWLRKTLPDMYTNTQANEPANDGLSDASIETLKNRSTLVGEEWGPPEAANTAPDVLKW